MSIHSGTEVQADTSFSNNPRKILAFGLIGSVISASAIFGMHEYIDGTEYAKTKANEDKARAEQYAKERAVAVEKVLAQLKESRCDVKITPGGEFFRTIKATRTCVERGLEKKEEIKCSMDTKDIHGGLSCRKSN